MENVWYWFLSMPYSRMDIKSQSKNAYKLENIRDLSTHAPYRRSNRESTNKGSLSKNAHKNFGIEYKRSNKSQSAPHIMLKAYPPTIHPPPHLIKSKQTLSNQP
jgi:hypothetical protein